MPLSSTFQRRFANVQDDDYDRIEDDQTAGSRGVTPQSTTTEQQPSSIPRSAILASMGRRQVTDNSESPSPYTPSAAQDYLKQQIRNEQSQYDRLVAPPPPMTLLQRIGGVLGAVATGARGEQAMEQGATLRDRAAARKQQERETLSNRISEDTRSLSSTAAREEGETLRARLAAQGQVAAAQRLGETIAGQDRRNAANIQGRADVAGAEIAGRADVASDKPLTKVMGNGTFQYDPSSDSWRRVGAAPIPSSQAPGPERTGKIQDVYSGRIDKISGPIQQRMTRLDGALTVLGQGTAAGDALAAPEVLSAVVGGLGSGLRMNEAEIARIVGGRDAWEGLKARLQQITPGSGQSLSPVQRQQLQQIVQLIQQRAVQVNQILDDARMKIYDAQDEASVRRIYGETQQNINRLLGGQSGNQPPPAQGNRITLDQFLKEK